MITSPISHPPSQVSFVKLLLVSSFAWAKLHHFRAFPSRIAHSSDPAPVEELCSHQISIGNTGKRAIYELQIERNLSHPSDARGLQAHCFPLRFQVNCRGESVMAFGYSCKSSVLAYGRNVLDSDSYLWYRANPKRLFFCSALGHRTLGRLLIPASLGLVDAPCFLHPSYGNAQAPLMHQPGLYG